MPRYNVWIQHYNLFRQPGEDRESAGARDSDAAHHSSAFLHTSAFARWLGYNGRASLPGVTPRSGAAYVTIRMQLGPMELLLVHESNRLDDR